MRTLILGAAGLLLLPVVVWLVHPWPVLLRWTDPAGSAYMDHRLRHAAKAGEELEIQRRWVPLEEIPAHLRRAVLIAEDDRFSDHRGVDWEAMAEEVRYQGTLPPSLRDRDDRAALLEALRYARDHRDRIRGRSTITQQLARNLYLSPDRSFVRKAQELLIAQRLEWLLSKDRILELYLNLAELGPGIFGVEAAAQAYFGRSASELSREQAASLAATLPHPLTSNPGRSPSRMAWRRDLILERMAGGTRPVPPAPVDTVLVAPPALELEPPIPHLPEGGAES